MIGTRLVELSEDGVVGLMIEIFGLCARDEPRDDANESFDGVLDVPDPEKLFDARERTCCNLLQQRVGSEEDGGDGNTREVLSDAQVEDECLCCTPHRDLSFLPLSVDVGVTLCHLLCCFVALLLRARRAGKRCVAFCFVLFCFVARGRKVRTRRARGEEARRTASGKDGDDEGKRERKKCGRTLGLGRACAAFVFSFAAGWLRLAQTKGVVVVCVVVFVFVFGVVL